MTAPSIIAPSGECWQCQSHCGVATATKGWRLDEFWTLFTIFYWRWRGLFAGKGKKSDMEISLIHDCVVVTSYKLSLLIRNSKMTSCDLCVTHNYLSKPTFGGRGASVLPVQNRAGSLKKITCLAVLQSAQGMKTNHVDLMQNTAIQFPLMLGVMTSYWKFATLNIKLESKRTLVIFHTLV